MFNLDLSELPDRTRPRLHRLARAILSITRELFAYDPASEEIPIEVHINNGFLPRKELPGGEKPFEETLGYALPTDKYSAHILVPQEAVETDGEYLFAIILAHELAHFLFNIDHNNGLVETFCEAYSFVVLERLAGYAKANPDFGFEPNRFRYVWSSRVNASLTKFPAEIRSTVRSELWHQLSLYLRYKRIELEASPHRNNYDYRFYNLGAAVLTSQTVPWSELAGISARGYWQESNDGLDSRQEWRLDLARATPNVRKALRRLGRCSDKDFVIATFAAPPWSFGGFRFYEDGRYIWLVEFPKHKRQKIERRMTALRPLSVRWEEAQEASR
ncbi:MAG: hypothetical protein V4671_04300 [Armatimonadota bacterium]